MSDYPKVTIPGQEPEQRRIMRSYFHPRSLMVSDEQYQYLNEVGNGNYSEGVRTCIEYHKQNAKPR